MLACLSGLKVCLSATELATQTQHCRLVFAYTALVRPRHLLGGIQLRLWGSSQMKAATAAAPTRGKGGTVANQLAIHSHGLRPCVVQVEKCVAAKAGKGCQGVQCCKIDVTADSVVGSIGQSSVAVWTARPGSPHIAQAKINHALGRGLDNVLINGDSKRVPLQGEQNGRGALPVQRRRRHKRSSPLCKGSCSAPTAQLTVLYPRAGFLATLLSSARVPARNSKQKRACRRRMMCRIQRTSDRTKFRRVWGRTDQ